MRPVVPINAAQIRVGEATTVADFTRCLEEARILAGPLSHRELESRSGRRLGRTKIGQVLKGTLPQRDFLLIFLEVCGVPRDGWARWLEVWGRLTRIDNGHAPPAHRHADVRPSAPPVAETELRTTQIIEEAQALARKIVAEARDEVAALRARAKAEAERISQSDDARILRAEGDRDAAVAQLRAANRDLEVTHDKNVQRMRITEEERDQAAERAHLLSSALTELQDKSRAQIVDLEQQRDAALAEVKAVRAALEWERMKTRDLSERHERLRLQSGSDERYAPAYLAEPDPDEVFGNNEITAPPVIGD